MTNYPDLPVLDLHGLDPGRCGRTLKDRQDVVPCR
jgi:hypothetical protein